MKSTTKALLDAIDWRAARTAVGNAAAVPQAIAALLGADTEEEAKSAYWSHLDNEVVVQGRLFEAAGLVIGPILTELSAGSLSDAARYRSVELLVEIALGAPHPSEEPSGAQGLQEFCISQLRRGLWTLYSLLDCGDERVVVGVLHILEAVEENRTRLLGLARILVASTESEPVRERATELIGRS